MLTILLRILQQIMRLSGQIVQIQTDLGNVNSKLDTIIDALIPGPAISISFTADLDGQITEGVTHMDLRDDQQVTLTITPLDKKGKPALVDGIPEWLSSNTDVATVTVSADGMSALVVANAPGDTATISVTADADLGAGITPIQGTLSITVVPGAAATVSITAGTPEDQPPTGETPTSRRR